ncbi:unnamed protein product [Peronospora belbahrii]|uniref:SERRATE/Ars2 N-terminal domain-containing protein n=1 Tax=Peronospora belbahrii TaxID=622444 RepID=A0AAU9KLF9_9STRA|nr:unnamed protein product [Peronospora belbahrii]
MEFSDIEDTGKRRNAPGAAEITIPASQPQVPIVDVRPPTAAGSVPLTQLSHLAPAASPGSRWNRTPNYSGAIPPPPSPPWILNPAQRSGLFEHRPPPPPPLSRQHPTKGGVQPPFVPPNDVSVHHPPPLHSSMPEKRYALVPDQHYGVPVEVRKDTIYGYQQPLQERNGYSSVRQHKSETREDRGYGIQQIKKSLQDSVRDRQYDAVRETREDRGYSSYQRHQNKSPRDSDRRYDVRTENREDRGYTSNRRSPQETNACALDPHYDAPINSTEERGYGVQLPQKPQKSPRTNQEQYLSGGHRQNKERFYEGKRSRSFSQSRSSRRERGRSRRRSCSRSSSRSRSKSYSVSSSRSRSPRNRSHCHTNRAYADGRRETKEVRSERVHSRRQRSRSCSSSRSSSSQSPSASPPAKRYRRRSSDRSPLQSSRRHSSHSTLRHPSHSTTEYLKDHPEEVVKDYLKEYTKGYSKEFAKDYSREYVKDHPKKYAKEYVRNYPKKHFSKNFPKEHVKDYRWDSHSLDPQYQRRSSSQDRHRSHPRDYDREDEPKGVDVRFKPAPAPEKLRRPTRWQPRP